MPHYLVTFRGYVDEHKRPEGFPQVIEESIFVRAQSNAGVVKAVNDHSLTYLQAQGMSVRVDPSAMEDTTILDTNRRWVPMHMLTHFDATVQQLTGEVPDGGDEKVPVKH